MTVTSSNGDIAFFSGNAHPELAKKVVAELKSSLANYDLGKYSDGEISLRVNENVRGKDVYILQSTPPPAENLVEILLLADALRRASVGRLTAVIPYMGYCRQDRRGEFSRAPISARVMADLLDQCGLSRILTVELHSEQIQGFFSIPVDNIYATPVVRDDILQHHPDPEKICVVSPDVGGVVRARTYAKRLNTELAIIDKRRSRSNESEVMNLIGEVEGKSCILVDDIVDTAGTLCNAARALKQRGAIRVVAYCTHAVLSGRACDRLEASDLDELVVTDTLPLRQQAKQCSTIRQISMVSLLAKSIQRITTSESVSALFSED